MNAAQLWLTALLILAPPVLYTVGIIIYDTRRRARRLAGRPTAADISARIEAERQRDQRQPSKIDPDDESEPPRMPPGWHWPTHDHDIGSENNAGLARSEPESPAVVAVK